MGRCFLASHMVFQMVEYINVKGVFPADRPSESLLLCELVVKLW